MSNTGTVKAYDRKRGFGFISPSGGGDDMFCHWADIVSTDKWPALKKDLEVMYDTKTCEKSGKEVACNVCDTGGGSIELGEAHEHKLSTFIMKGTVKMFAKKGFGFIQSDSKITWPSKHPAGTDIYVSREDLVCEDGTVMTLRPAMKVQFKVFQREGVEGLAAAEVCAEDGSPLSIEPREPGEERVHKGKGKGKGKSSKGKGKKGSPVSFKGKGSAKGQSHMFGVPMKAVQKTVFVKVPVTTWGQPVKGFAKGGAKGGGKGFAKGGKGFGKGAKSQAVTWW